MAILDTIMIYSALYAIALPPILLLIKFFMSDSKERKRITLYIIISAVIVSILGLLAGTLYNNPRPFVVENSTPLIPHAADNGFPSDHVLAAAMISSVLTIFSLPLGIISWIITLLIGYSRVYVGVHHPIDILASIVIAISGTALSVLVIRKTMRHHALKGVV